MDKGQGNMAMMMMFMLIIGLVVLAFYMGWIPTKGGGTDTPTGDDLPDIDDEEPTGDDDPNAPSTTKFQQCTTAEDCNWDKSLYYNRDCDGAWRCLNSPYPDTKLCSFGCNGNEYCGDDICGGMESSWSCIDCNPEILYIGELNLG